VSADRRPALMGRNSGLQRPCNSGPSQALRSADHDRSFSGPVHFYRPRLFRRGVARLSAGGRRAPHLPCDEKRGLTTSEAVARLARALGVQARDVGYAGMKDRNATTRQWLSLPAVEPSLAAAVELERAARAGRASAPQQTARGTPARATALSWC